MVSLYQATPSREMEFMVNGLLVLLVLMALAGFGGFWNGILHYSGHVWPRFVKAKLPNGRGGQRPKNTVMLGIVGNVGLGFTSGLIIFMFLQRNVPMFHRFDDWPTGGQGLLAIFGGLGGTFVIDKGMDWFEKQYVNTLLADVPGDHSDRVVLEGLKNMSRTSVGLIHVKDGPT